MYALVLRVGDYLFLIDYRKLWKAPVVHVRRGVRQAEVWLSDEVTLRRAGGFVLQEADRIVQLVAQYQADLLTAWSNLKDDAQRGCLQRNTLMD